MSYCELRAKEVVNVIDGRRLGRVVDVVFCAGIERAEVLGIVVPFVRRLFLRNQEVFVPWSCIKKIGEDVILVDLVMEGHGRHHGGGKRRRRYDAFEDGRMDGFLHARDEEEEGENDEREKEEYGKKPHFSVHTDTVKPKAKEKPNKPDLPNCDRKCEKCMLFDCEHRWK